MVTIPDFLVVNLQPNPNVKQGCALKLEIMMENYIHADDQSKKDFVALCNTKYVLFATMSLNAQTRLYTTCTKRQDQWYKFLRREISPISEEDVLAQEKTNYLFFIKDFKEPPPDAAYVAKQQKALAKMAQESK